MTYVNTITYTTQGDGARIRRTTRLYRDYPLTALGAERILRRSPESYGPDPRVERIESPTLRSRTA